MRLRRTGLRIRIYGMKFFCRHLPSMSPTAASAIGSVRAAADGDTRTALVLPGSIRGGDDRSWADVRG
ncbi:hypothetical protein L083_2227 [Actinoplanes sp. N902-109]|nr:hypothetical protein L083_2227 [Actinoplanes sp. N902-109]